jgi:hypothetical protein
VTSQDIFVQAGCNIQKVLLKSWLSYLILAFYGWNYLTRLTIEAFYETKRVVRTAYVQG